MQAGVGLPFLIDEAGFRFLTIDSLSFISAAKIHGTPCKYVYSASVL